LRTWKWIGRSALWLLTFLFGLFEIAAIGVTVSGQWQPNTVSNALIGNACFGIPFIGLLWFAVRDLRRMANGGQQQHRSGTQSQANQVERATARTEAASGPVEPLAEPPREQVDWVISRPDRGNPPAEYAAFAASNGIYWTVVSFNSLLIIVLAIAISTTAIPLFTKVLLGLFTAFLTFVTIGFAKMASSPTRLEIGSEGIQVYSRSGTSWFPWQVLDRVEIMRLEGGNRHLVGWCTTPEVFPQSDSFRGGPRFLPKLKAVAICPLNILHTRRHLVARALQTYGANRYGQL
jgi:hypothetical protein